MIAPALCQHVWFVTPTDSQKLLAIDLTQSHPEIRLPPPRPSVVERLRSQGILPAGFEAIPEETLVLVEQLFITWHELDDDRARRLALGTLFGAEAHVRAVLLAVVPIYFDPFYFDARTPTRDLVELALVAHRKWRTWREWLARSRH